MSDDEKLRLKHLEKKREKPQIEADSQYVIDSENRSQHKSHNENEQNLKKRKKEKDKREPETETKDEHVEPEKAEPEKVQPQETKRLVTALPLPEPFQPEEKEVLKERLSTLDKRQPLLENKEPLDLYISARNDIGLVQLTERYSQLTAYEAIQNLAVEENKVSIFKERSEKFRQFNEQGLQWKKAQLDNPRAESGIFCDKDTFTAVVPLPIADRLTDMGTLEPETVEFLNEKFAHLQALSEGNRFKQSQTYEKCEKSEQTEKNERTENTEKLENVEHLEHAVKLETVSPLSEAVVHANEQMKPARKNKVASERAQEQIEIIQQEIWAAEVTPRYMNYCEIYYDCDCHDAYYVIWFRDIIGYEKQWKLLEPEKKIVVLERDGRLSVRDDTDRDDSER